MELDGANKTLAQIHLDGRTGDWRSAKLGEVLTATVIKAEQSGRVTLRLNGTNVTAQTQQPLAPGQQITVRITGLGAKPSLEIVALRGGAALNPAVTPAPAEPPLITLIADKTVAGKLGVGRSLLALVTAANPDGTLELQTAAGRVTGRGPAAYSAGQLLELESVRIGRQPALAVTGSVDTQELVSSLLRAALPRQTALPPLLAMLASLSRADPGTTATLPQPVKDAVKNIMNNLSSSKDVSSADGLRKALLESGVFFENTLLGLTNAPPAGSVAADLKTGLFRLIEALLRGSLSAPAQRTGAPAASDTHLTPPLRGTELQPQARAAAVRPTTIDDLLGQLLQQVDGVLARLHISQLSALPTQEQPQPWLNFEIPLRHGDQTDVLQLRIEQDEAGSPDETRRQWTIHLAFDLEHLGPAHVRVTLQNRNISTLFWAEQRGTVELFEQHMAQLQDKFSRAGLTVGAMHCQQGKPPRPAGYGAPELLRNLEA